MPRNPPGGSIGPSRGFSLVELAVALAVMAGLLYFLLDRVLYMQEMAEKTEVEETVRSINMALRLEAASRMARGLEADRGALERQNPMQWLSTWPHNYLGQHERPPEGARPAYWYYQPRERLLVYRPYLSQHLAVDRLKEKELRFVIRLEAGDSHPVLRPHTPYAWFGERKDEKR